jgi:hypothetical protein
MRPSATSTSMAWVAVVVEWWVPVNVDYKSLAFRPFIYIKTLKTPANCFQLKTKINAL